MIARLSKEDLQEVLETAGEVILAEIHHQLSERLWRSNEELKSANEGLQKFTSIAAHDLRGPLRRIEAFVDVLQTDFRSSLNDEGVDILDRIACGVQRMRLTLDSLLKYSRYNSAAIAGKVAHLTDVTLDALSGFDLEGLGASINIELNEVSAVKGDPVLLSHVLQNLIGNAVKFRANRPLRISIEASQVGDEVTLCVADNGIGIEPRFADKIFDMFYRLHDEDEYDGAGIGLAICQKIVTDHGGRIWLDTDCADGTRFVITLKAASSADLETAPLQKDARFFAVPAAIGGWPTAEVSPLRLRTG